jgi:uncharacterized protein YcgI (DUF1989 family)
VTDTTYSAREHARAQVGQTATSTRTVPAPAWLLWEETLGPGRYTTKALARGTHLCFTDVDGLACAQLLLFNAWAPHERLNVADTAKVQWQAYLGGGSLLLTDMGRVIATVVADTSGMHDLLCGSVAARPLLTLGVARLGLDRRDVHPCANLLKGVRVVDGDRLSYTGGAGPGASIALRLELPAYVVVTNSPHPLADDEECTDLQITAERGAPAALDDPFRLATPEATRAFENTDDYLLGHSHGSERPFGAG